MFSMILNPYNKDFKNESFFNPTGFEYLKRKWVGQDPDPRTRNRISSLTFYAAIKYAFPQKKSTVKRIYNINANVN